jgi:hypothetical protein
VIFAGIFSNFCKIYFITDFLKSFFEYKKMFTEYTNQLMSIILCSTLVIFYLVVLYGEFLLKKAAVRYDTIFNLRNVCHVTLHNFSVTLRFLCYVLFRLQVPGLKFCKLAETSWQSNICLVRHPNGHLWNFLSFLEISWPILF